MSILRNGTVKSDSDISGFAALRATKERSSEMTKRPRRNHGAAFKAKVTALEIKGYYIWWSFQKRFQVHPNQIAERKKKQLLERAPEIFDKGKSSQKEPDIKELHAKIWTARHGKRFFIHTCSAYRRASAKK